MTEQKREKHVPLYIKESAKIKQSLEVAPEPEKAKEFDTTTPADLPLVARRFTLGDLPRYADKLFPILQKLYPHLNDRMYGGWLRGCIDSNSSLFICVDGGVALAQVSHDPLDPVPYVQVVFVVTNEDKKVMPLYEEICRWGKNLGAKEVRTEQDLGAIFDAIPFAVVERRPLVILHLLE